MVAHTGLGDGFKAVDGVVVVDTGLGDGFKAVDGVVVGVLCEVLFQRVSLLT